MSMTIILCPPEVDVEGLLQKHRLARAVRVERAGSEEELEPLLRRHKRGGAFEMTTAAGKTLLRPEEIVTVRACGHIYTTTLRDGREIRSLTTRVCFEESMKALLEQGGFYLCRSNTLVNLAYVASMEGTQLTMKNGAKIEVARARQEEARCMVGGKEV